MRRRIAVLLIPLGLAACSGGGGTDPVPGIYDGTGDDDLISFTVTSDLEISELTLEVPTLANASGSPRTIEGPWTVADGEFEINLVAPLGLEEITIEGRFIEDGTEATGTYTVEPASGVEVTSDNSFGSSGSWNAAID